MSDVLNSLFPEPESSYSVDHGQEHEIVMNTSGKMAFGGCMYHINSALSLFRQFCSSLFGLLYNFDGLQYTPKARNGLLQNIALDFSSFLLASSFISRI